MTLVTADGDHELLTFEGKLCESSPKAKESAAKKAVIFIGKNICTQILIPMSLNSAILQDHMCMNVLL